jgi:hypothetical protein
MMSYRIPKRFEATVKSSYQTADRLSMEGRKEAFELIDDTELFSYLGKSGDCGVHMFMLEGGGQLDPNTGSPLGTTG